MPLPATAGICDDEWPLTFNNEIAVAGDRAAWLAQGASNNHWSCNCSAHVSAIRLRARRKGTGRRSPATTSKDWDRRIGLLAGDRNLIAFASWTIEEGGVSIVDERVWAIDASGAPLQLGTEAGFARSLSTATPWRR